MKAPRISLLSAAILSTSFFAPGSLDGAVVFTATTKAEGPAARLVSLANSTVRGAIDGDRGRIEFLESRNGATPKGSVILTADGGKTAVLFDPAAQACRRWVSFGWASRSNPMGPGGSARYENLKMKKTLDEAGPKMAGRPTRHYRFTIAYDLRAGDKGSHAEYLEDLWADAGLSDPGFAIWLTVGAPRTGIEELDRKLSDAMAAARGALLKRVSVARYKFEGRPEQTITTSLEVEQLSQAEVPASTFLDPFPCKIPKPEDRR